MALNILADTAVKLEIKRKTKEPMMLHDGGGLYLQRSRSGSVSWIFRFRSPVTSKSREMGLGAGYKVTLAQARAKAAAVRVLIADGKDPIEEDKKAGKSGRTFREHFDYMSTHTRLTKWKDMLDIHAKPIDDKPVTKITTEDVVDILGALINGGKWETARKLQQRIHSVISSATGSLDTVAHRKRVCLTLRGFKKGRKNKPHPSVDYEKLPALMRELGASEDVSARALEFVILTTCRTGDVTGTRDKRNQPKPPMVWDDIDFPRRVWRVPAIKTADDLDPEPFEVPLSDAALATLRRMQALKRPGDFVFPGQGRLEMSSSAMRRQLLSLRDGVTVHGMRTAFRTWAGERTSAEHDVIETALAHKVFSGDKAEAAYKAKTKFFEKRRKLMQGWGEFVTARKVVALKAA